ncbi:MAG TPA: acyltransferase [Solirubrobacteraceae bacterium]
MPGVQRVGPVTAAGAAGPSEPPGPPARRTARQGEFLAGDGIRGIGMVCIIMAHLLGGALVLDGVFSEGFRGAYGELPGIIGSGFQLGLPMFFVLSGYLISRPWVRAYVLDRRTPSARRYIRSRVLRIVPVFWLIGGLMLFQYGSHGASLLDLTEIFGFAQIYHETAASLFIGQAWTIDVEVAFYVFVPIGAWLLTVGTRRVIALTGRSLSRRERVAVLVSLLAVATVASAYVRGTTAPGAGLNESLPATFYYFGPGVALAALELEFTGPLARARLRRLAPFFGLSAAAIAVGLSVAESHDTFALIRTRGALAVAAGAGLALGALLARQLGRGDSPRWVDNRLTRWLGARSYPCYLLQSASIATAVAVIGRVGGGPWIELLVLTAFVVPVTIAFGAVVHATIERPLLTWGHGQRHRTAVPRAEGPAEPAPLDQRVLAPVIATRVDAP